ncbi:cyanophycinase [Massilia antarctica]|uniref:cyanophycinase n=1 Tax=Massilia antarctica TaxID=2765360 RepID=UPI0006BB9087|nr:cyanophycinase [Massilia sp. H27-R4]MCY0913499.1 cyanophycinase [Massilia sp. H27-R4]CUI09636.1 Cyanophycinase [Janthinobacterium sp. CG23_2]CUU33422.1 Cyanophycinase [Janthinobacterium sp. CG23_2]
MLTLARRYVQFLILVLLAAGQAQAAPAPAPSVPAGGPKGSLVIIGGALRGENAAVWKRIVELAGGPGARIAVFGSASASPDVAGKNNVDVLNSYGADAFVVPVAVKLEGVDYRVAANDPVLADAVRHADGAYFVGGNQARIIEALRKKDGSSSLVLDALWSMYRNGGVIAGTSAGAAIMSSTMFYDVNSVLSTLKRGVADGMELAPGLGFIGKDVFVDQHLLVRGRFGRMLPAMLAKGYKMGLGIDENTSMIIHGNRDVEVLGYKGALLIDLNSATATPGDFNVSNAKLSYLDNGDRFNLLSGVFTPSREKLANKLDPAAPYYRGPLFFADILGNTTVVDLMHRLIDSDQTDAIGLTLGSPRDLQPELGFEFRFSRTKDSVGYMSAISDTYSVFNIRLDVLPILIRQPLYQYK